MNINTGKIASNSDLFMKKLKDNDTNGNISVNKTEKSIKEKLVKDFADIKTDNNNIKSRIISNNAKLTENELELSKYQFIDQRINLIDEALKDNNSIEIKSLIKNSNFNNINIIKEFISEDNFTTDFIKLKALVKDKIETIDKNLIKIEIASQNVASITSSGKLFNEDMVHNFDTNKMNDALNINNKNVYELIS